MLIIEIGHLSKFNLTIIHYSLETLRLSSTLVETPVELLGGEFIAATELVGNGDVVISIETRNFAPKVKFLRFSRRLELHQSHLELHPKNMMKILCIPFLEVESNTVGAEVLDLRVDVQDVHNGSKLYEIIYLF